MKINVNVEKYLELLYKTDGFAVIDGQFTDRFNEIPQATFAILNTFHASNVFMIERDDDYFCGIRADHFVVEVGVSEMLDEDTTVYVVSANHKGLRSVTVVVDFFK